MSSSDCPSPEQLKVLLAGGLAPSEENSVEDHLSECSHCQRVLEDLVGGSQTMGNVASALDASVQKRDSEINDLYRATTTDLASHQQREPIDWQAVIEPIDEGSPGIGHVGPYVILEHIASGGMGAVFRASDKVSDRTVAVKVLGPQWSANELSRKRFLREARASAALDDEHILPIYRVDDEGPHPYIVMPYVDGETLEERVMTKGALPIEEAERIALAIAQGLEAAHAIGIVHRDLKPANVLIGKDGRVRIADFGLARSMDTPGLTVAGTIPGTPQFMAPEQIEGASVDHRADLFALGSLLQFMVTGKAPFEGGRLSDILQSVCADPPTPLSPSHPAWFRRLVEALLTKSPEARISSASEVTQLIRTHGSAPRRTRFNPWLVYSMLALLGVALILGTIQSRSGVERRPQIVILETGERFPNFPLALLEAPSGATLEFDDGVYTIPDQLTLDRPLTLRAAAGATPILQSSDPVTGGIFIVRSPITFEGLTFRHHFVEPSAKSLIVNYEPIILKRCRLEQTWDGAGSPSPIPSAIFARNSVTLERCEVKTAPGCAVFCHLTPDLRSPKLRLEECAILATRALYLSGTAAPEVEIVRSRMLAGLVLCIGEDIPRKRGLQFLVEDTAIEASAVMAPLSPWQSFVREQLPNLLWEGRGNRYRTNSFCYSWEDVPVAEDLPTLASWIGGGPLISEVGSEALPSPLFLKSTPANYRVFRSKMLSSPSSAKQLLVLPEPLRQLKGPLGGNLESIGPGSSR